VRNWLDRDAFLLNHFFSDSAHSAFQLLLFQMAAAIVALRANKSKPDDVAEEGSLFDTLVSKLPSIETWDTEFYLGVLVLGSVDDLFFIHFVA
jgi:hypothetical protein